LLNSFINSESELRDKDSLNWPSQVVLLAVTPQLTKYCMNTMLTRTYHALMNSFRQKICLFPSLCCSSWSYIIMSFSVYVTSLPLSLIHVMKIHINMRLSS